MVRYAHDEMSKAVLCIAPTAAVAEATELMRERRFHHLPVLDGEKLVGILSQRDLPKLPAPLTVGDVMTRCVTTCTLGDSLGRVADLMIERRIHALPVLNDVGQVVGIITSTDLLQYLRRTQWVDGEEIFDRMVVDLSDIGDMED